MFSEENNVIKYNITEENKVVIPNDSIKVEIGYFAPYDWELMMGFFESRRIPGVDYVSVDGAYRRSIVINNDKGYYSGWIEVKPIPNKCLVVLTMSQSLKDVSSAVTKQVRVAFDLDLLPGKLPSGLPKGIRLPGCFDLFELSTRVILGQQISVKAASTLAKRVVDLLGIEMNSPWEEVRYHFPTTKIMLQLKRPINDVLGEIGVIKNRSNTILAIAKEIDNGNLKLKPIENIEIIRDSLMSIKGIGAWSAEYLIMRAYSWPDAFLVTDLGVKNSLLPILLDKDGNQMFGNVKEPILSKYRLNKKYIELALIHAEKYKPYRSYYNISLWQSLSNNER